MGCLHSSHTKHFSWKVLLWYPTFFSPWEKSPPQASQTLDGVIPRHEWQINFSSLKVKPWFSYKMKSATSVTHACNTYGLLTKCEVKMAGNWPSSFLRVYGLRRSRGSSRSRKKRTRPISSHLDRTNLVNKGFIIWLLVKFCLQDTAGSPKRARWLHLARSGSQSQRAIWFILPARGDSRIIKKNNWHLFLLSLLLMQAFFIRNYFWNTHLILF